MLALPDDIDLCELAAAAGIACPLVFLPVGEDSYNFRAGADMVRVQKGTDFDPQYQALDRSRTLPFEWIIKPRHLCTYKHYFIAVFPFVEGRVPCASDFGAIAKCLRDLHGMDRSLAAGWREERLDNPFTEALNRVLESDLLSAVQQRRSRTLIREFESLGESLRGSSPPSAITHGDPNTSNWIVDRHSGVHLCDWGGLALGPRERDLFAFSEPELQMLWTYYGAEPNPEILEFYRLRWILQEIADYGTRLLDPGCPPEERTHAQAEFDRYAG